MSEKPVCGNCAHSRKHEQMGGLGLFCHGKTPDLHLLPQGSQVIRGKQMPMGLQLVGLWPPVDAESGWCCHHTPATIPGEVMQ
jgi:hypothetical protein